MKKKHHKPKVSAIVAQADLIEALNQGIENSVTQAWENAKNQMRSQVYCTLWGYNGAEIEVVDGSEGETWYTIPFRKIVDEWMESFTTECGEEPAGWIDSVANDLEKEAKRIRALAEVVRKRPSR